MWCSIDRTQEERRDGQQHDDREGDQPGPISLVSRLLDALHQRRAARHMSRRGQQRQRESPWRHCALRSAQAGEQVVLRESSTSTRHRASSNSSVGQAACWTSMGNAEPPALVVDLGGVRTQGVVAHREEVAARHPGGDAPLVLGAVDPLVEPLTEAVSRGRRPASPRAAPRIAPCGSRGGSRASAAATVHPRSG